MTRFVVDLGGVEMSKAAQSALSTNIQKMVLSEIAELRVDKPIAFKFPFDWWGIILHPDLGQIGGLEKELGEFARG